MPVYEYECDKCEKVFEVQQRISDAPLEKCPECEAPVRKLMSMSSFQLKGGLKGGGWYSDGYSSTKNGKSSNAEKPVSDSAGKSAPPACQTGAGCKSCPAAATG
ncbi:MAG: zinc ribbon domain-containing protein [Deltaproteobacteria bacterium]|nr:zinc ribbon domain-containing protein [Deltaproteobacteria bacterium]